MSLFGQVNFYFSYNSKHGHEKFDFCVEFKKVKSRALKSCSQKCKLNNSSVELQGLRKYTLSTKSFP
jgi:hypothetical protein